MNDDMAVDGVQTGVAQRTCEQCHRPLPVGSRASRRFCNAACRAQHARAQQEAAAAAAVNPLAEVRALAEQVLPAARARHEQLDALIGQLIRLEELAGDRLETLAAEAHEAREEARAAEMLAREADLRAQRAEQRAEADRDARRQAETAVAHAREERDEAYESARRDEKLRVRAEEARDSLQQALTVAQQQLGEAFRAHTAEVQALRADKDELTRQNERLREDLAASQNAAARARQESAAAQARVQVAEHERDHARTETERVRAEADQARRDAAQAATRLQELHTRLEEALAAGARHEQDVAAARRDVHARDQLVARLREDLTAARAENEAQREHTGRLLTLLESRSEHER